MYIYMYAPRVPSKTISNSLKPHIGMPTASHRRHLVFSDLGGRACRASLARRNACD